MDKTQGNGSVALTKETKNATKPFRCVYYIRPFAIALSAVAVVGFAAAIYYTGGSAAVPYLFQLAGV